MNTDDPARIVSFVNASGEHGLRRAELAARTGWHDEILNAAIVGASKRGEIFEADGALEKFYIGREASVQLAQTALDAVEAHHEHEPLSRGIASIKFQIFSGATIFNNHSLTGACHKI